MDGPLVESPAMLGLSLSAFSAMPINSVANDDKASIAMVDRRVCR